MQSRDALHDYTTSEVGRLKLESGMSAVPFSVIILPKCGVLKLIRSIPVECGNAYCIVGHALASGAAVCEYVPCPGR